MVRRALKKLAARVLPEALKSPLRGRLYGYRASGVAIALDLAPEPGGLAATIDGSVRLRVPAGMEDDLVFHLRGNGESVEEMWALLAEARRGGARLLYDVGAHRGLFAHLFCAAGPGNRAVAFEPSPVLAGGARALRARNALEDRVEIRQAAVGRAPAEMRGSVDPSGFIVLGDAGGDAVEMVSLDAECERRGERPDVVKIDVEGFEDEVVRGAAGLLASHRPVLLLELHLDALEGKGVRVRDLVREIAGHGYRFYTPLGRPLAASAVWDSPTAVLRCVAR